MNDEPDTTVVETPTDEPATVVEETTVTEETPAETPEVEAAEEAAE